MCRLLGVWPRAAPHRSPVHGFQVLLLCRTRYTLSHFKIQIAFDAALILIVTLSPLTFLQAIGLPHICNVAWEWFEGAADLYLFSTPPHRNIPLHFPDAGVKLCSVRTGSSKKTAAVYQPFKPQSDGVKGRCEKPQKWERFHFLIDCLSTCGHTSIWL